ncbi:MAG TPA: DUF4339 domain-containing protein [Isosphaeraceae bacterium]|jgi:hypothetical protein|nr:DUF4339 domain-containing protein [Isosphaeraceae bacterium]
MANEWFYAKDGQKFGPITGKRLKELATIGVLRRNDLIWSPGYSVWRPAKKFRGLLPKMDATSLNPAMSLFWKPTDTGGEENRLQGMFLEPDSPATAVTPPLPSAGGKKASGASHSNGASSPAAVRTATKRPSAAAAIADATSSPTAVRPSVSQPAAKKQPIPQPVAIEQPKGGWMGLSSKEKILIGGGLAVMLLVYLVLMYRALR